MWYGVSGVVGVVQCIIVLVVLYAVPGSFDFGRGCVLRGFDWSLVVYACVPAIVEASENRGAALLIEKTI